MISEETLKGLKVNFASVHPLMFYRSKERAKTGGELFDILSKIPTEFPIVWSEENKQWLTTKDLFQSNLFKG